MLPTLVFALKTVRVRAVTALVAVYHVSGDIEQTGH